MAFSSRYGYYRDELYFLDCARHLDLSYVDQPVFTPLITRLSLDVFGLSLAGLRLWPAFAGAGTVITGGLLAREFGGRATAQLLGAIGVATAPAILAADHIMGPTAFDLLFWSAFALVAVRIGRTGDTRLWLPGGLILGIGLSNKHSIVFFALALVIGTVLSGGGRVFANRYFVGGAGIAALCALPDVWWQAHHGWATVTMTRALAQNNGGAVNALIFLGSQAIMASPALILLWLAGLRFLWRSGRPLWRGLAWSYGLLLVLFAATSGAKPYYVAATYFFLIAAGAVEFERNWSQVRDRSRALFAGLAVAVIVLLPLELPVLPANLIGWTSAVDPITDETIGWPEFVQTVAGVWDRLPAGQRAHTVIFTASYGEAGAIDELARGQLPTAVSGHNNVWFWGPGNPQASTVIAVLPGKPGPGAAYLLAVLHHDFASVSEVATLGNNANVRNEEAGGHVYLCQDPVRSWGQLWPTLRHYGPALLYYT